MILSNARWPPSIVKLAGCSGSSEFHFLVLISSWTNIFLWGRVGKGRLQYMTHLIPYYYSSVSIKSWHIPQRKPSVHSVANKNQEAIPSSSGERKAYSHFVFMSLFRCSWPGGICKGLTGKQLEAEMLLLKHAGLFISLCCLTLKPLLVIGGQQSPMAPIGFKMH